MQNIDLKSFLTMGFLMFAVNAEAADNVIIADNDKTVDMAISIYNNNLALVKDTREVKLENGFNEVNFVGVASSIMPETAMLFGSGIKVIEQNYDYNLLTPSNILDESVGKTVKTALYNEQTGETIFDSAKIIDSNYGSPILEFSYGIETNFPGRIIYDSLPDNLRVKPTLVIKMNNDKPAVKKLELAYLTNGMSWKADYIADIKSKGSLDLNGWITLKNESGISYENAQVQVIAGNVNQVSAPIMPRPMMYMARGKMMNDSVGLAETSAPMSEAMADYYLYNLPIKTTINANQTKQVSLFDKNAVKFEREYKLVSPLYVGLNLGEGEFEKQNPSVMIKIKNLATSNLGLPMPQGIIRFYENDAKGNMQFIGESNVAQTAIGEEWKLNTGKSFDIYAKGVVQNVKTIAKDLSEAEVMVTFNNAKAEIVNVVFEQNFNSGWEIISESLKSVKKSANVAQWKVEVSANGESVLSFKVRIMKK